MLMTPPLPRPDQGLNAAVAAQLRAERAAQKMTMGDLAEASDIPFGSLRRYLSEERHIDVAVLEQVAQALGTTAEEIVRSAAARLARVDVVWEENVVVKMGDAKRPASSKPRRGQPVQLQDEAALYPDDDS